MPVDILFTYFILEDANKVMLILLALLTAVTAQMIDYFKGKLLSDEVIHKLIGVRKYNRSKNILVLMEIMLCFF